MGRLNWTDRTATFLLALDVFGVKPGMFFSLEQAYTLEPILKKIYPQNSNFEQKNSTAIAGFTLTTWCCIP